MPCGAAGSPAMVSAVSAVATPPGLGPLVGPSPSGSCPTFVSPSWGWGSVHRSTEAPPVKVY